MKSSGPITGGRASEGWTPTAEPSLEGQPAGRSGPLLQSAWPYNHPSAITPTPGKVGGLFQSLLLFPPVRQRHFTHKPCAWCGGGGRDSDAFALFLCPGIAWWVTAAGVRDSHGGLLTPGADNLAVTGDSPSRADTCMNWKSMTCLFHCPGHLRGSWGWERCDYPMVSGMESPEDVLTLSRGTH